MKYDLIAIVGPTASGKTSLATNLAYRLGNAEVISADSRQLYRGMDLGTGKDLADYCVEGKNIPYHLIDIADAGEKYNLFQYQEAFKKAYEDIVSRGQIPVLCGGSGLYVESVLKGYRMAHVPENPELRERLSACSLDELAAILARYKTLHNTTDIDTVKRAVRAIEIQEYYREHPLEDHDALKLDCLVVGVDVDREVRRQRITARLHARLQEGMVEEVRALLENVSADDLIYYGLEYKYLTLYCIGQMSYDEMVKGLEIAIHQFAKRQMTWFRGMERRGIPIHWIDASKAMHEKVDEVIGLMNI